MNSLIEARPWLLEYWKSKGYDHIPKGTITHTSGVVKEMITRGMKLDIADLYVEFEKPGEPQ